MSEPHSLQPGENAAPNSDADVIDRFGQLLVSVFGDGPYEEGMTAVEMPAPADGVVVVYETFDGDIAVATGDKGGVVITYVDPDEARSIADALCLAADKLDGGVSAVAGPF